MEAKPTNHLWLSYFALPQALPGCSHLPTHPGTSNQDMLLNCQPCPPLCAGLFHSLAYSTCVTLTQVHEQSWLGSFGRLGIFSQPMECGRLQGLPSPDKECRTICSFTFQCCHCCCNPCQDTLPQVALPGTSSSSCPCSPYPSLSQQHSHPVPLRAAAGDGPVQVTPFPCCCSPASSVKHPGDGAHTSFQPIASSTHSQQPENCRKNSSGCCRQSMGRGWMLLVGL